MMYGLRGGVTSMKQTEDAKADVELEEEKVDHQSQGHVDC